MVRVRHKRGKDGCLTVLGITTWNHIVRFCCQEAAANTDFQVGKDGMSTPGKVVSESRRRVRYLVQSGQSIAEHKVQIQGSRWLIQGPESLRKVGI